MTLAPFIGLLLGASLGRAEPPSPRSLERAWRSYARHFVERQGRVVDPRGSVTTSEGQAYALARAVFVGDRARFERIRSWTRDNLQGGDETALPAWRYGAGPGGRLEVLDPHPAADADLMMAWALLRAGERWGRPEWRQQGLQLAGRIWEQETMEIAGHRQLLPGPWARGASAVRLNPSYFQPALLRVVAAADPGRPWLQLIDGGYALLDLCLSPSGLPPDWVWIDPATGALVPPPADGQGLDDFGFEAFRVPWNLALDLAWNDEGRARTMLGRMDGLRTRWVVDGRLPARIRPDGSAAVDYDYMGMYAALLPAWALSSPDQAERLWQSELEPAWNREAWAAQDDYYAANWLWFGVGLWSGALSASAVGA